MIRKYAVTLFASMMLVGGVAGPAAAQQQADGLVVVQIGDITTGDILSNNKVAVGVAAQVAANICGVKVGPVAILGVAVDRSGDTTTVCTTGTQTIRLVQNQ